MDKNKLKHGAIYEVSTQGFRSLARCNISAEGDEYWFTRKDGSEIACNPLWIVKNSDKSFSNNDVK